MPLSQYRDSSVQGLPKFADELQDLKSFDVKKTSGNRILSTRHSPSLPEIVGCIELVESGGRQKNAGSLRRND